jgi:hypothetical protein
MACFAVAPAIGVTTIVCVGSASVPVPFAENVTWPGTAVTGIVVGGLGSAPEVGPLSAIDVCVAFCAVTVAATVIESTPVNWLLTPDGSATSVVVKPKSIGWFTGHDDGNAKVADMVAAAIPAP